MLEEIQNLFVTNEKLIILVLICVLVDTATGITKAITNNNFSFKSKFLKRVIVKCINYISYLVLFGGVEVCISLPLFTVACITEVSIEIKSISENVKDIPFKNLISNISDKIKTK